MTWRSVGFLLTLELCTPCGRGLFSSKICSAETPGSLRKNRSIEKVFATRSNVRDSLTFSCNVRHGVKRLVDRLVEGIRRFRREAPARSEGLRRLATKGRSGVLILAVTLVMILATNLLIGVATGFGLALAHLLMMLARLDVQVPKNGNRCDVHLRGAATFMSLPKLGDALASIPDQSEVHIHLDEITCLDRATAEHIDDWRGRHPRRVILETDRYTSRKPSN